MLAQVNYRSMRKYAKYKIPALSFGRPMIWWMLLMRLSLNGNSEASLSGRWPPSKIGDGVKSGWFKTDSLNSGWFMTLPQFWVKSEGSLKSGRYGVHCGEMTITQNWATTVLVPQIWVTHSKLREIKTTLIITQAFTSQNINLVVVSNSYKMFNHMH